MAMDERVMKKNSSSIREGRFRIVLMTALLLMEDEA
jgi:hypothetical protein